jgi:hypothetical protein
VREPVSDAEKTLVNYPGWLGSTDRIDVGARIIIFQWNDESPVTQKHKAAFAVDYTQLSIVVNNKQGTRNLTLDPASLEFHFANYSTLKAIPPREILSQARADRDGFLKRWGGVLQVAPGGVMPDGLAFLPPKTDLTTARAVTLTLNGQQIVVPGKYCTPAEKREILDQLNGR